VTESTVAVAVGGDKESEVGGVVAVVVEAREAVAEGLDEAATAARSSPRRRWLGKR
jgi:hypothetical protein